MAISVRQVHPLFFGEVTGVNIANGISPEALREIEQAFDQHAVLVLPGQDLEQEQQIKFSTLFGPLEIVTIGTSLDGGKRRLRPELGNISNLDADDKIRSADDTRRMHSAGNRLWHTDSSYMHIPAKCSLLYARIVPSEGGNTEFADLRAAYDDLPQVTKDKLNGLVVEHSVFHSRAKIGFTDWPDDVRKAHPPARQLLVRTHPGSKRKTLYLASHASHIIGWPVDEGRALLSELIEHATQRKYVHSHRWTVGDLVMWDNRCTMHRATQYDDLNVVRELHRTTVQDTANTLDQERMLAA